MAENEKLEQTAKVNSDKADKAKKDNKKSDKKPGIFARAAKWLKEMKSELKKVQWPSKKQTINNTVIVIVCVLVIGAFIWLFDFIAQGAINILLTFLR